MDNATIAGILREIGIYLEMENVPFKPRAYEKASEDIASLSESVADIYAAGGLPALEKIPGIGVSIAGKIGELLRTGKLKYYEQLKKKTPVDLKEFEGLEGLGPKTIKELYRKLRIRNLADLEKAAQAGKIGKLAGFGKKSEENILKGIAFVKRSGGRFVLGSVLPGVEEIAAKLGKLRGVDRVDIAGSIRRRKETVGDADLLVIAEKPKQIMDYFVSMPDVARVYAHGETKSAIKLNNGLDVDLRVIPKESYGAALNYFTGSKDHNIALREIAIKKGLKLNEYGLFKGKKAVAGKTEEEIYRKLGFAYIEPELREMTGELEAARADKLPKLIGYGDLKGDLQVQTDWTDGDASIEEMAKAAMAAGLEYIAITDHTKRLAMTRGLDGKRIKKQWAEIDRLNRKYKGKITILKGTECDILKDGTMDLPDSILAQCDVVGGSVHSLFNLPQKDQTKRIMRAMSNPHVDILFHPTGRVLNKREAYAVDMDALIAHAKKTKTVMEIDAFPERADLKAEHIRKCVEAGVKLSIDSDAHDPSHIPFLQYGIAQARRGWAEKKDIINAQPVKKMLKSLK
ncbi:MAG: DNA polymerase/3'-5' exonuclease PolX [Patescibacteria group bacterium]|nr:DNA polymerase/3'-5' exonuclease PolX [Patescibacteria group bacterium]